MLALTSFLLLLDWNGSSLLGRYARQPKQNAVGRPLVSDAADENLAEEAEEFGTTITELAGELKMKL